MSVLIFTSWGYTVLSDNCNSVSVTMASFHLSNTNFRSTSTYASSTIHHIHYLYKCTMTLHDLISTNEHKSRLNFKLICFKRNMIQNTTARAKLSFVKQQCNKCNQASSITIIHTNIQQTRHCILMKFNNHLLGAGRWRYHN